MYYVDAGEHATALEVDDPPGSRPAVRGGTSPVSSMHPNDSAACGCMIFRAGAVPALQEMQHQHSYFSIAPVPGRLWLFPGRMPHMVMGQRTCVAPLSMEGTAIRHEAARHGQHEGSISGAPHTRGRCRVSVAVNFSEVGPPEPKVAP